MSWDKGTLAKGSTDCTVKAPLVHGLLMVGDSFCRYPSVCSIGEGFDSAGAEYGESKVWEKCTQRFRFHDNLPEEASSLWPGVPVLWPGFPVIVQKLGRSASEAEG